MIEVSVLTGNHDPAGEGLVFELLSETGKVIGSSVTDGAGVVRFDVDSARLGPVTIRWAADAGE